MIQVLGQTSVNFINRKKLTRELSGYLDTLIGKETLQPLDSAAHVSGEDSSETDNPQGGSFKSELDEFAEFFVDSCLNSKAYGTAIFGTIPMSREGVKTRLLQDIDEITVTIPKRFGLEKESAPIRDALLRAFEKIAGKSI